MFPLSFDAICLLDIAGGRDDHTETIRQRVVKLWQNLGVESIETVRSVSRHRRSSGLDQPKPLAELELWIGAQGIQRHIEHDLVTRLEARAVVR